MRKMRLFMMLMAIAAVSFTFTSCDDDPWADGYWDDPYGWYMITTMVAGDGTRIIGMKVHRDHMMMIWSMRR